jgi:hypothetical protein
MGQWPRATFAVLDRAGHGLTFEQSALLTTLVDDWLDRVSADREAGCAPHTPSG